MQNAADSITIKRSIYYFNTNRPFTDLQIYHGDGTNYRAHNILENIPTLTASDTTANIIGQVLLPYSASDKSFEDDHTVKINDQVVPVKVLKSYTISADGVYAPVEGNVGDQKEIVIPGPDGVTPQYRLVSFITTSPFTLTSGSGNVVLSIKYGSYETSTKESYKYLKDETVITDMFYLSGYKEATSVDISSVSKLALNGSQVEKPDFYVLVKTNVAPKAGAILQGSYLPLGASLVLTEQSNVTGLKANEKVYKVEGFSNGQQK